MSIEHPSFGKLDDDRIIIFDTTLRDGEQSPGFSMNINEKIRMAEALTELGVDVMEAGFPIASPGDFESVKAIAESIGQRDDTPGDLPAWRAPAREDVLRAAEAVRAAKRKRIHIFIATSALHMKYKLRMEPDEVIAATVDSVDAGAPARRRRGVVGRGRAPAATSTSCAAASRRRSGPAPPRSTCPTPSATRCPRTWNACSPWCASACPGIEKVILSTHNHNDLGLAVANTLAAIRAGARQVETTINGIGERAGNASLEEIVMAIRTRQDAIPCSNHIETTNLLRVSKLLAAITGFDVQPNKAIVGRNAFAHEAGIHQDGVLKHAGTYEIMTPESVGWAKNSLVMGKHSGRAAFRDKLKTLGYQIGDNQLNDAFRRFKDLADRKKVVFDDDIVALVDDEVMRDHERIRFVSLDLHAGSKSPPRAEMELEVDGVVKSATASGDGPVDATFKAIQQIFPHTANLVLFSVGAVTEGTDAQAKTTVRLEENGKMVDGQGADTDTIVASARAYVHALNKLLVKRVRTEPQALSA